MASYLSFYQVTSIIWAVVSDGHHAYAFKYRKDETFYKDKILVIQKCRKEPIDSGVDFAANDHSPYANDRLKRPRKIKNEVVRNFIPAIAAKLQQELDGNAFDWVVLVAPRDTLNALRASLSDSLCRRLLTTMPEGYVYDKGGAIFAMQDAASVDLDSSMETYRDLPPCCLREAWPRGEENRAMSQ